MLCQQNLHHHFIAYNNLIKQPTDIILSVQLPSSKVRRQSNGYKALVSNNNNNNDQFLQAKATIEKGLLYVLVSSFDTNLHESNNKVWIVISLSIIK